MKLENNQTRYHTHTQDRSYDQRMRETFNHHINDIVDDCIITDLSIELTAQPAAYRTDIECALFHFPEKRIFTYEGYTKSDKWFKLIYCE